MISGFRIRQAYMQSLQNQVCGNPGKDLLDVANRAIEAMETVIAEKLTLFGSVNKAHLHQTPYAKMLADLTAISPL